ncbi:MAG: hypothetical protein J7L34_04810 [Thermotogaceae bacterium]|nr:hypothetical protein [Thermotogaceae bacterium]
MNKLRFFTILFVLIFSMATFAQSNGMVVTVEGYGMNKQQALDDAYRRALEEVAGAWIKAKTKVEDMTPIEDLVLSRVSGFVKLKKIVSYEYDEDMESYKVVAEVEVIEENVKEVISDLLKEAGDPSVGLIIKEEYSPKEGKCEYDLNPMFLASSGLNEKLSAEGITTPDISTLSEYNETLKKSGVSDKDLVKISQAAANIVSYILYVKANYSARYVEEYDVCSVRLNLEGKLVRADTGEIVKAYAFSEVLAGGTPEAAINRILKKIIPNVTSRVAEDIYMDRIVKALSERNIKIRFDLPDPEYMGKIEDCVVNGYIDAKKVTVVNKMGNTIILSILTMDKTDEVWEKLKDICSEFSLSLITQSSNFLEVEVTGILNTGEIKTIVLRFDLEKFSLSKDVKSCVSNISDIKSFKRISFKPYTIEVKTYLDVEDLIDVIINCEGFEAEVEDIAEDGSWVLFSVK